MFKKQFTTKTEAPLRGSDRRKLRSSVIDSYNLDTGKESQPTEADTQLADLLVPNGIKSTKFTTSLGEHGLLYISPEEDPLWFTDRDRSSEVLPTVYTLWKCSILPIITTPPAAIESLLGGSDLFIPGVSSISSSSIPADAVVSIASTRSPTVPLAVGRMLLDSEDIKEDEKGKAVHILHTWKDTLWQSGSKPDPPSDVKSVTDAREECAGASHTVEDGRGDITPSIPMGNLSVANESSLPGGSTETGVTAHIITADEADSILQEALLHCLYKIGQSSQPPEFPIPTSTFYSSYILPNRRFIPPSSSTSFNVQELMKRSSHKKLSKFLSSAEKEGLLRLKQIQKPSPDTLILSLNTSHDAVRAHADSASSRGYRVVGEEEGKRERKERAGKERETASEKAVDVLELWKPHAKEVITLFKAFNVPPLPEAPKSEAASEPWPKVNAGPAPIPAATISSPTPPTEIKKSREQQQYFTSSEVKTLLDRYISSHSLVHPRDRKYIVLDATLKSVLAPPQKPKNRDGHGQEHDGTAGAAGGTGDAYFTREELLTKLKVAMQPWYEIRKGGKEGIRKKGALQPITVKTAQRAGKKVVTLVTNFEPFLIDADHLAESLRKSCAGATSVGPKEGGTGMEVLVQGNHAKATVDLLIAEGTSQKWIEIVDLTKKKK